MSTPGFLAQARQHLVVGVSLFAIVANLRAPLPAAEAESRTATPIQHVVVIIGENRTFDHIFATYQPAAGQSVNNLLSEGIVNADGTPGPNFSNALQSQALDSKPSKYLLSPQDSTTYVSAMVKFDPGAPFLAFFARKPALSGVGVEGCGF